MVRELVRYILLLEIKKTATAIDSQLKVIVRSIYSSPPLQGARIVSRAILSKKVFQNVGRRYENNV